MTGGPESSLPHFLCALEAVLDHLGPVHALVGHSMGGAAAAMIMARRPDKVGRGVLIAAPASLTDATYQVAAALAWPPALTAAVRRRIEYRFGVSWDQFEAERNAGSQDLLVIHDRADREVAFACAMRHIRAWPRARLLETEGLGHRRLLTDPTVLAATADFLAGGQP
jgi:pimeloyl-ACP methyl ester carboxylesterase